MEQPRRASVSSQVAASSQKRNAESSRGMFEPTKPQFFKIILEQNIRQGKLDFPVKFARLYGHRLSSPVTLQVPTGANWQAKLSTQEGKIWLEEGWKEFADYHGLEPGHFVVFQHEGHSHFLVTIMDMSSTEIEYPVSRRHCNPPRGSDQNEAAFLQPKEEAVNEIVEILDDPSPLTETRAKGTCSGVQGVKMEQMEEEVIEICNDASPIRIEKKPKFTLGISMREMRVKGHKLKGRAASKIIASRALKASINFTSEYPSFKLIVEPEHLAYNYVIVPFDVVLRNIVVKKQTMVLEVGDEGWEVEFRRYDSNRTGRLSNGWLLFAQENVLQAGDVCAFELISPAVFKVTIFRGVGGMSS